jgi:hypothetical protein
VKEPKDSKTGGQGGTVAVAVNFKGKEERLIDLGDQVVTMAV